ncbi:hypothetical protein [Natronospira bacteriovora]|uniref:Transcriptional regulator n=1 Tax=Natronospira bacteriovora TaxID=3069753 RepID=A0ABU0W529_9GAMM|nr:hypothetical protein [Natronospira sp. AB-CW4]MDQ2069059.1 hypothetical protein [Natronospira sp. AB-CW4]
MLDKNFMHEIQSRWPDPAEAAVALAFAQGEISKAMIAAGVADRESAKLALRSLSHTAQLVAGVGGDLTEH